MLMKAVRNITLIAFTAAMVFAAIVGSQSTAAQTEPTKKPAVPTPTPPIDEEEGVIKIDTEAVNVLFTAQDKDRRLLLTLKPADFQIFENGQLQQVSAFSRQIDLPLSLAILIDTSMSQE